jgi:hypothetical protein
MSNAGPDARMSNAGPDARFANIPVSGTKHNVGDAKLEGSNSNVAVMDWA